MTDALLPCISFLIVATLDVDECQEFGGGCQYQCQNTHGGFICRCPSGQHLHVDGKSCIRK